jgi:hydroxypyruvate reductase 1
LGNRGLALTGKLWKTHNPEGESRVIVTKDLPGRRWLKILTDANCRVDVRVTEDITGQDDILEAFSESCQGAIGQLSERWDSKLFESFSRAGGKVYSNYAVGYDNVDLDSATLNGIPVGNTPGILTETTAEMAVALSFAAARRVVEGDRFMREERFRGWLPSLFLGNLMRGKTLGVIGAGRIGSAYARMMVEGHKMNLIYFSRSRKEELEEFVAAYGDFLASRKEAPVTCTRAGTLEELLQRSDVVSLHTSYSDSTHHMINKDRLRSMKEDAILINTSRGSIIDEAALVDHCRKHKGFRAALDVFEKEPRMASGLKDLDNVVVVPHLGSATRWTREGMAILAALNVGGILRGYPAWNRDDILSFLGEKIPPAAPSIINAEQLGISIFMGE